MALTITLASGAEALIIGFNNSALPLGERDDLIYLLKIAYESERNDYLAYFENPPTYPEVLDELGEESALDPGDHAVLILPRWIKITASAAGHAFSDLRLEGKTVDAILKSDATKTQGFEKDLHGSVVTFGDDTTVAAGEKLIVFIS